MNKSHLHENGQVYQEILTLAKNHKVSYEATDFDLKAEAISRLSDNDITVNDAMRALVSLRRDGVLTAQQGHEFLGKLMDEMEVE